MSSLFRSDRRLAVVLIVLMVLILTVVAVQQSRADYPPYVAESPQPEGVKGLLLWLEEIGYGVSNEVVPQFEIPAGTEMVLMVEPQSFVTAAEWDELDRWVARGGTLVVIGETPATTLVFEHFGFGTGFTFADEPHRVASPLWASPPVAEMVLETSSVLVTERTDFVPLVANGDGPLVVAFAEGDGRVILGTVPYVLTNAGLEEEGNSELVLNVVSLIGREGEIWINEWHHGIRGGIDVNSLAGPEEWVRNTAAGQSILLILGVIFVALLLSGRRFGRPVALAENKARRAPLEYITAIANLNRRAGHRMAVQQQYRLLLKRRLGERYRLRSNMEDARFVKRLVGYNPAVEGEKLLDLLGRLSRKNVSEGELVGLAQEVNEWVERF